VESDLDPSDLSYARGESEPPLLDLCIGQMLDRTAAAFPSRPALVARHTLERLTWAGLHENVERLARALMAIGIQKGDRVGIWATNRTEWVLTQFATAKIGAILVNLNIRYRAHEVEYALKQSECQTLILMRGFHDCDYVESLFSIAPQLSEGRSGSLKSRQLPHLSNVIFIGDNPPSSMLPWHDLMAMAEQTSTENLRQREASLSCFDAINIQYTSGTTGFPKGATLSHHNVVNNGLLISDTMELTDRDSVCIPVPFYHCFGMVLANMSCLASGAAMVLPSEAFDPLETLRTVQEERCTALYGVPTMFIAEFNHPQYHEFNLTSLRTGIMAGSSCPTELMRRVVEEMHCSQLTIVYGLTESSPGMTQTRAGDSLQTRVTTVGKALPHTEVRIVNPKTGAVVPHGTVGEICTRGYLVMKGYYNDPKSTADAIEPDGWLHSGDLGTMGDDGYVRITGRIKELIIRGGENIYPREIEEFLHTCPAIADVQVIGIPDDKYGEEVMAWVKLKRGATLAEQDVKSFCKGQIASYKIPRYVRFVDSFPMTGSGKIQKFRMREISLAEMSESKAAAAFASA
jgi:fatty-acyl-CoA synthase